jgi:DNA-binding GntR family transcriptional regulator
MQMSGTEEPSRTNAAAAYEALRAEIVDGRLQPGQRLRTAALAERLGFSRTPIREALVLLEGEGLVKLEPRRGAVVRAFAGEDLMDLYEVRALLEAHAARRAAEHIGPADLQRLHELVALGEGRRTATRDDAEAQIGWNVEFHRVVCRAADSPRLLEALRAVAGIPLAFRTATWLDDAQRARSLASHREVADALSAGSAERAEAAMRMHLLGARDYLRELLRRSAASIA